ncbi:MAG: ABC transporter substrate-binding protein [Gammaproteobacteria bacterium]|nr:ABC transporter substrate-binding protein [Gammaproteobacteria bacterium]
MKKTALLCSSLLMLSVQGAIADVNVGITLSSTGPGASLGIPEKNALKFFPTEAGGEKINYIVLDDATDPSAATKNARKLVSEDKVDILVGSSVTPSSLAVAEVAVESGTPQIAIAPINLPPEKNAWVFRTPHSNSVMASALVEHMQKSGVKTLGFIGYSDAYGEDWITALTPLLEENSIELVATERYNRTDTSVSGQVLKLISRKPDAIIVVGSGSPAALPQTALVERRYQGQIYQTHAAANQAFLGVAGKAAEGVIMPVGPVVVVDQLDDSHPSKSIGAQLVADYNSAYGDNSFASFASYSFDAGLLIADAVPKALAVAKPGTAEFRMALRDALQAGDEVVGTNGVYHMTEEDHFGLDPRGRVLVQIKDGKYNLLPM